MTSHLIVTAGVVPHRFSTQLVADANGALYLFGGRGDSVFADLRRLEPVQRSGIASTPPAALHWSQFAGGTAPAMRMGAGFIGSGTELYLFGGASNLTIKGGIPSLHLSMQCPDLFSFNQCPVSRNLHSAPFGVTSMYSGNEICLFFCYQDPFDAIESAARCKLSFSSYWQASQATTYIASTS